MINTAANMLFLIFKIACGPCRPLSTGRKDRSIRLADSPKQRPDLPHIVDIDESTRQQTVNQFAKGPLVGGNMACQIK